MLELPAVNCAPRQDVPTADDDANLHSLLCGLVRLAGDVDDLGHADAALAGRGEALAREFQNQALVFRFSHASHIRHVFAKAKLLASSPHKKAPVRLSDRGSSTIRMSPNWLRPVRLPRPTFRLTFHKRESL